MNQRTTPGFSLIELLTVMAILGIMIALITPAATSLMRSTAISNAGDQVLATFSQARQLAASRNRAVEVRLYKYLDPTESGQPPDGRFRAIQLFLLDSTSLGTSTNALGRKFTLPGTTYFASSPALSSLLDPQVTTQTNGATLGQSISPVGLAYSAATFRFYPDGSTSLPPSKPLFLTVVSTTIQDSSTQLPKNFATIVLQPSTGKAGLHRP